MERGDIEARPSAPSMVGPFSVVGGLAGTEVLVGLDDHHRAVGIRAPKGPIAPAIGARVALFQKAKPAGTVPIVGAQLEGPEQWVATELVAGIDLLTAVAELGPLSPVLVSGVATAAAEVLAVLHKVGLHHGGLHPNELLLTADGPLVAGLGSPHDAPADAEAGAAADIGDWAALVACAIGADPTPTGTGFDVPGLDLDLARLVRDGLSPDPAARPSVDALLKSLLGGFVPPNPTPMVRSVLDRTWLLPPALVARSHPKRVPKTPVTVTADGKDVSAKRRGLFRRK